MRGAFYFDIKTESSQDVAYDHALVSVIRNGLKKIFLPNSEWNGEDHQLPIVKMIPAEKNSVSFILVSVFYPGVEKFFHEMISSWLLPGKKLSFSSFFYANFVFSSEAQEKCSFCEIRLSFQNAQEYEELQRGFSQIAPEIKVGAISFYQGNRVLRAKGRFSSEKDVLIHERISSLIQKRPEDFDYDVFGQMQHFFVSCPDGFKEIREPHHLSRMVYIFYLFRRSIRESIEKNPKKRHISFKVSQVRVHSPFGIKNVLGVFVGLHFLKPYEIFDEGHLERALKDLLPEGKVVPGSFFVYHQKEERIHVLYLEVEKPRGGLFSLFEIRRLRDKLPGSIESQIEKLMPSLFMPRNEEEVMKNVVVLAQQLRYIKDLPQVYISFEEQTDMELTFTVILLRVSFEGKDSSVQELFSRQKSSFLFIPDRIKKLGAIRGKYYKEATVFRLQVSKSFYLRRDHSVDLLTARQDVVREIFQAVGEFRDYNGGMIANQVKNLYAFKQLFPKEDRDDLELENFFHTIFPIEMRGVTDPNFLKTLYLLLQEVKEDKNKLIEVRSFSELGVVIFLYSLESEILRKNVPLLVQKLQLSSSQSVIFSAKVQEIGYQGYILVGLTKDQRDLCIDQLAGLRSQLSLAEKTYLPS
jgi:hypothetical protein